MHALFFEVRLKPGHLDHYFDHVALLRPVLAQHTGLRFLDRYGALNDTNLLLSHQLWDSEDSIIAWRKDILTTTVSAWASGFCTGRLRPKMPRRRQLRYLTRRMFLRSTAPLQSHHLDLSHSKASTRRACLLHWPGQTAVLQLKLC